MRNPAILYRFYKFYDKFGIWGIILLTLSIICIAIGLIATIIFIKKISLIYSLVNSGEKIDVNATGMVGEFYGGVVGTIWSLAGVLLFFLALRLQSKELSLQIKELKDTREVFSIQQFENTFFNLLKTQQDIKLNVECDEIITDEFPYITYDETEPKHYKSHLVFEYIKSYMIRLYSNISDIYLKIVEIDNKTEKSQQNITYRENKINELKDIYEIEDYTSLSTPLTFTKTVYKLTFNHFHNQLGHYFRNLYHILNYLKENESRELLIVAHEEMIGERMTFKIENESVSAKAIKKKFKKYSEFIQAQMSASELFLLFYNGLFFEKMKTLIHHFDFLENLSSDDLLNPEEDVKYYSAFKKGFESFPEVTFKSRAQILKM